MLDENVLPHEGQRASLEVAFERPFAGMRRQMPGQEVLPREGLETTVKGAFIRPLVSVRPSVPVEMM